MENKKPLSHEKNVTGSAEVKKRGEGLGTGQVGTTEERKEKDKAKIVRAAGISLAGILVAVFALLFGGGMMGGGSGGGNQGSGGSNTWQEESNTGTLDESVASGARAKRTQIKGNGEDVVTIMIYLCGTDLESRSGMATADMKEMMAATLSDNVNLIIYTGGCTQWKTSQISNRVNQIYQIKDGKLICLEEDMGTSSMTNPANLTEFINYCKTNFPANRNELIFWDHGGGSITGYGYDEKNKNSGSMNLAGIDKALADSGMTFDFIGFDACLMATLETGLTITKYADYMIASEETEPGVGWYYTNWLTELSKDTSKPTVEVGKRIVDDFVDVCAQTCRGQLTTLSIVDLAELEATVPKELTEFAKSTNQLIQNKEYKTVSDARFNTREFGASSRLDQVDLVNLANNMKTEEGEALSQALMGAVKYNRTSSNMANAYGIAIYFPYQKTSGVDKAVSTYEQIGMDSEYSRCIKEFAGMEHCGQQTTGGANTPLSSLSGGSSVSQSSAGGNQDLISQLLGDLAGGSGLSFLSGRSLSDEETAEYLAENYFDPSAMLWTKQDEAYKMVLPKEQWDLIQEIELNVFVDDGEGYIDLGLDNQFTLDDDQNLIGTYDGTWLAINGQPIAYYHTDTVGDEKDYSMTGYVPIMLNGERAELILVFDTEHPDGYVSGARRVYAEGETETVAKSMQELVYGDTIDFICDYFDYDGGYLDSYYLGDTLTVDGAMVISYVKLDNASTKATYRFTDIYHQTYWTPEVPQ